MDYKTLILQREGPIASTLCTITHFLYVVHTFSIHTILKRSQISEPFPLPDNLAF